MCSCSRSWTESRREPSNTRRRLLRVRHRQLLDHPRRRRKRPSSRLSCTFRLPDPVGRYRGREPAAKKFIRVTKTIEVKDGGDKWARFEPDDGYKLAFSIVFNHPAITSRAQRPRSTSPRVLRPRSVTPAPSASCRRSNTYVRTAGPRRAVWKTPSSSTPIPRAEPGRSASIRRRIREHNT